MATYTACCTRVPKCSAQEQNFVNSRRIKLLTPNAGPWNHHRSSRIVKSRANAPDPGNALLQVASNVKSTGVPLLEELMQLSMSDATARAVVMLGRALAILALGSLALGVLHAKLSSSERQRTDFRAIVSSLASLSKPAMVLLPYYTVAHIATIVSALAQVAAFKMKPDFDTLTRGESQLVVDALCRITQILQDTTELVLIVGGAWAIKRLKDRAIKALQLQIMSKAEGETSSLARLMEGGSAVLNWVIWAIAALTALSAYGIDPSPLLASLGASSLVIGLAAQSVLSNTISGIALYASSSFKVGDHIELLTTSGSKVLHGTVQAIGPAQVVFRDEDGALIYINNSEAAKLIVRNLSQSVALLPNQG